MPAALGRPGAADRHRRRRPPGVDLRGQHLPEHRAQRGRRAAHATSGRWRPPTSTRCAAAAGTSTPASPTWTWPASARRCASRRSSPGSAARCSPSRRTPSSAWPASTRGTTGTTRCGPGTYPGRIIPTQITWLRDPQVAADLVRANAERGFRALSFAEMPAKLGLPSLHTGHWDPLLAACEETGTVVCLHTGSSSWVPLPCDDPPFELLPTLFSVNAYVAAADWLWSGVCTRFPNLRIAMSEGGVGWVNMLADRVDYVLDHSGSGHRRRRLDRRAPPERGAGRAVLVLLDRRPQHARRRARAVRPRPRAARGRLPPRRLHLARHPDLRARHDRPPAARR